MIATDCKNDNFSEVLDRLDEFGLTPNQFRVYCHLLRSTVDGVVSDRSSESIAKVCKLTQITVLRVVSDLSKMNLIECDRAAGRKTVFHLMPYSSWRSLAPQEKKQADTQQSKVIQLRVSDSSTPNSDTCSSNEPVKQFNSQQEAEVPCKGTSALLTNKAVNEIDVSTSNTGEAATAPGGFLRSCGGSLDEKLAAARERGWQDSGTWWMTSGQQMVTVNRFVVSVAEFMRRSLDSFDVGRQVCAEGIVNLTG